MKEFFIDIENDYDERYNLGKFMKWETDNYDPLTSHVLNELPNLKPVGAIPVAGNPYRPDVLAYQIFGDTQYWWLLIVYNAYLTVDDIQTGKDTAFFDINDLENLYFSLSTKQDV